MARQLALNLLHGITVCMAFLVFVLCQPVHSCIEPSLHGLDFFLEIFLWRLYYDPCLPCVCRLTWDTPNMTHHAASA